MTVVPDILQRLVALHGVDADALDAELCRNARVRTRTWMAGGGTPRHVIECLPTAFPPFKAVVVNGILRIEGLRFAAGALFQNGARFSHVRIAWPDLPDTIVLALPGRPLAQLIGHTAIGFGTTILSVGRDEDGDGSHMTLDVDMPRAPLHAVDTTRSMQSADEVPDIDAIVARTHDVIDAPPLTQASAVDARTWTMELGVPTLKIIGLRIERPAVGDRPHVAIRFPYDKDVAGAIGRSGIGTWFDRNSYAWQLEPTAQSIAWLGEFIAAQDIVIGPDGRIHCRRTS